MRGLAPISTLRGVGSAASAVYHRRSVSRRRGSPDRNDNRIADHSRTVYRERGGCRAGRCVDARRVGVVLAPFAARIRDAAVRDIGVLARPVAVTVTVTTRAARIRRNGHGGTGQGISCDIPACGRFLFRSLPGDSRWFRIIRTQAAAPYQAAGQAHADQCPWRRCLPVRIPPPHFRAAIVKPVAVAVNCSVPPTETEGIAGWRQSQALRVKTRGAEKRNNGKPFRITAGIKHGIEPAPDKPKPPEGNRQAASGLRISSFFIFLFLQRVPCHRGQKSL